jgi:hypothetical protein
MKTPNHLKGLIGALTAVEKACEGTDFEWLLREDKYRGYFANITNQRDNDKFESFPVHARSAAEALSQSLMRFNLRLKRKKP